MTTECAFRAFSSAYYFGVPNAADAKERAAAGSKKGGTEAALVASTFSNQLGADYFPVLDSAPTTNATPAAMARALSG